MFGKNDIYLNKFVDASKHLFLKEKCNSREVLPLRAQVSLSCSRELDFFPSTIFFLQI